jgi:hypothetical protein
LRGWLPKIIRFSDPEKQIPPYSKRTGLIELFSFWTILPFDLAATTTFRQFPSQKNRAGSMNFKIASLAVSLRCTLLTATTRDFANISELQIENWLD